MVYSGLLVQAEHQIEVAQDNNRREDEASPIPFETKNLCNYIYSGSCYYKIVCLYALTHLLVLKYSDHNVQKSDDQ